MAFKGKAPGSGSGEMSRRTEALRPGILLSACEIRDARRMRRAGIQPESIAETLGQPLEEVEKALVQMRMPRPETTRGTLNVTLAAHRVVLGERRGDEPVWQTFDRIIDELLRLRVQAAAFRASGAAQEPACAGAAGAQARRVPAARRRRDDAGTPLLPGLVA